LTGWTTILDGAEVFTSTDLGAGPTSVNISDGTHAVDLPPGSSVAGGGIQQIFATLPGSLYEVTFDAGTVMLPGKDGTGHVQVEVAGTTQVYQFSNFSSDWGWAARSFTFTALEDSTTLAFKSFDNANLHIASIDNVSVRELSEEPAPVPEPSVSILLIMGILTLAHQRRRKSL
jgi:hypothetical protein